jgi:FlaA1/EpsC-like NDP-sugar epimerase
MAPYRVPILFAGHILLFTAVYLLAYVVRFDGEIPQEYLRRLVVNLPLVVGVKLAIFVTMDGHRGWWRYTSFADLLLLAETTTLGSIALAAITYLEPAWARAPRSILLIDWAGSLMVLGGLRSGIRSIRERYYPMISGRAVKRVLIVGASTDSASLVGEIARQPHLGMRVIGILDQDRANRGRILGGVKILGTPQEIPHLAARLNVQVVLVPTGALAPDKIRELVGLCGGTGVKLQVVPRYESLLSGRLTLQPRDIDINDLLSRDPVRLDSQAVGEFLRGRAVLVTGAAGSIGSEICRQILAFRPTRLVLLDFNENGLFFLERELRPAAPPTAISTVLASINDATRIRETLELHRPQVVFHAAAHKHVPVMEVNPGEAVKNNVFGTRTLVDEAVRAGVEAFVMISTDKAVNPTSVMGATKRTAEAYVQALSQRVRTRLITVRFGNVLGSNGSVVPIFKEQIRRGGPLTLTHPDMTRFFMTIPEAAQLVLQAGSIGHGGEIFVLDMGEPVRIIDLARDMIRLSGLREGHEIEIVTTGLRTGEKLYEELYDHAEQRLPTTHPKIFRARHRPCDERWLIARLEELSRTVDGPAERVIAALKRINPEYRPQRGTEAGHSSAGRPGEVQSPPDVNPKPVRSAARESYAALAQAISSPALDLEGTSG